MSTKTLYLAIVAAAAIAPAAQAMPASTARYLAPGMIADSVEAPRLSDAARGQILDSSAIHLAKTKRPFTQMGNPWMQSRWTGQMRLPGK
jgi:hypothetical protein